jgi:hypothetical protein
MPPVLAQVHNHQVAAGAEHHARGLHGVGVLLAAGLPQRGYVVDIYAQLNMFHIASRNCGNGIALKNYLAASAPECLR